MIFGQILGTCIILDKTVRMCYLAHSVSDGSAEKE